jgi:hypothetical protein
MLGKVADWNDEERPRMIHDPRIVRFGVRHLGWQTKPAVPYFSDFSLQGLQNRVEVERTVFLPLGKGGSITNFHHVDTIVAGKKGYACVETRGGRKRATARSARIIGEMWSVPLGTVDHVVPTRITAARGCNEKLFKLGKGHWGMPGFVGKYTVWDLGSHEKAP